MFLKEFGFLQLHRSFSRIDEKTTADDEGFNYADKKKSFKKIVGHVSRGARHKRRTTTSFNEGLWPREVLELQTSRCSCVIQIDV